QFFNVAASGGKSPRPDCPAPNANGLPVRLSRPAPDRGAGPCAAWGGRPHCPAGNGRSAPAYVYARSWSRSRPCRTMRVLLVEDDPALAESVERYLRQEGFAVDAVASA